MLIDTPSYVTRPGDAEAQRVYLGTRTVEVCDDGDDEFINLHVDAAHGAGSPEVLIGPYRCTPASARVLAAALLEVADHVDPDHSFGPYRPGVSTAGEPIGEPA